MSGPVRVLLADHEEPFRQMAADAFRTQGYECDGFREPSVRVQPWRLARTTYWSSVSPCPGTATSNSSGDPAVSP